MKILRDLRYLFADEWWLIFRNVALLIKVNQMFLLINLGHHIRTYVMRGLSFTAAVFEPMTKYWKIGHKLPHMLNKDNFGLRKILKISEG